ncbi:MAG: NAD(+) diphosphatase [Synergistaceae bacterium]|nr:NAD(+) diphosphatase [Synergistaceae bacterium]
MSFYYIFQDGRIVLKKDGSIPLKEELPRWLTEALENSGYLDKNEKEGDRWGELPPGRALPEGYAAMERRGCWTAVGEEQFFRIGKAFHLMDWQRLHKFCGRCGARNSFDPNEGAMKCAACGELFYPVISPAVIVSVEKEGKILLGHGVNFPAGRYSVLAGFVEPGESIEECVAREIYEESKIRVKNIKYFASQPWPFPRSLMLGLTAEWESGEISPDKTEVSDVRWFAPDEIPDYYRGVSISARLIEDFIRRHTKY